MKKLSLLLLTLTICFFTACHKSIWEELENLDQRVTKLEELCKEMNTNITSLQTIVSVLQSNDYITGIVEIKKNGEVIGYTITFGQHDPITIYHGQDGKDGANGSSSTPVIGVAQDTDGVYYWTLNGEWLLDDNGNKLPVSGTNGKDGQNGSNGQDGTDGKDGQDGTDGKDGQDGTDGKDGQDGADGKDGVTPQLKIEDGYWYISYDNGATWTQLGKATGEDGKDGADGEDGKDGQNGADGKDGQDGDSMFQSVTQDENYVYFTLADGTIIKIAKGSGSNNQPSNKDIIVFRDLAVKSALLKLDIDTTGDGEISYGEASAYKGELLITDKTVLSFKEFKYFKNITSFSFNGCSKLFELEFPMELTTIANSTFNGCSSLTHITLPSGIISIGNYAFRECTSLRTITLPNGLISIGENAFENCSTLVSAEMPNSVTSIGRNAFYHCPNMHSFTYPEKLTTFVYSIYIPADINTIHWNVINMDNAYQTYNNTSYCGLGYSYYSQNSKNKSIKAVVIGENVQKIPAYLCEDLQGLTEIIIPESVTKIGNSAFDGCTSLSSVSIGENVTSIGRSAFYGCTSLVSITFPKNVTSIGSYAFNGCSQLKYCYSKASIPPILETNALPTTIGIIYVPRASVDEYRALWSDYANKIVGYDFE